MNKKFVIGVAALLLVFVLIEVRMPRHFVWKPTFGPTDTQPFGCKLFDDALAASMPQGYSVTHQTLWQLQTDSVFMACRHGIVVLTSQAQQYKAESKQALKLAQKGHVVLVATGNNALGLEDTLGIYLHYNSSFSPLNVANMAGAYEQLEWVGPLSDVRPADHLCASVAKNMLEWCFSVPDSVHCQPLIVGKDSTSCFAASFAVGKGELIVVSAPLLLTNYGMLNAQERLLIARLMGRMKHLPVVRTTAYTGAATLQEQTPLYVFLQRPPLRWAVYLSLLALLLFMVTTARRRQRVVPVIEPPHNGNLEFVRLVGKLFYLQGDHRGLVALKLGYAADDIMRLTGVDIREEPMAEDQLTLLARLTGFDTDVLRLRLANAREATTGHHVVTAEEMKTHIDSLNEILVSLS